MKRMIKGDAHVTAGQTGDEPLVKGDAVHIPIPIRQALQQEERHGYCEREDHRHAAYSG
jgi:hypothetical protein